MCVFECVHVASVWRVCVCACLCVRPVCSVYVWVYERGNNSNESLHHTKHKTPLSPAGPAGGILMNGDSIDSLAGTPCPTPAQAVTLFAGDFFLLFSGGGHWTELLADETLTPSLARSRVHTQTHRRARDKNSCLWYPTDGSYIEP